MRRCFEHVQLRRYFHCCYSAPRSTLHSSLRFSRSLPETKPYGRHALPSLNGRLLSSSSRFPSQDADLSPPPPPIVEGNAQVTLENNVDSNHVQQGEPDYWVSLLEQFLPSQLRRVDKVESPRISQDGSDLNRLLGLLTEASARENVDILGILVLGQRRHKAAIYLVEVLLNHFATVPGVVAEEQLPSNISWPVTLSPKTLMQPIELDHKLHVNNRAAISLSRSPENGFNDSDQKKVLQIVWPFLANLVIASSRRPPEESKDVMSTVHQILARMHSLDIVPATVYTYSPPQATIAIQKPPILNLLNSRILSTLSDAVWRAQQDDAIAQALKEGKPLRDVSRDPPGGRFRLRVRELGPEVWMEFILWCCVEGGHTLAGIRIINLLREDTDDQWSAIHWTTGPARDNETPRIDWDRVKRRHGGPVGQREAYSGDQPFVEMPRRTISAEVVLALIDCLITSLDIWSAHGGLAIDNVARKIRELVSFLEPHELPPAYFDYLTVRFLQSETVRRQGGPDTLRNWATTLSQFHSLEAAKTRSRWGANFDFDAVIERSELQAGVLHQALQVYVDLNLVTKAVDTFTDIQKLVDASKLETIGEFLSTIRPRNGFFTSRARAHVDFSNSHGQLPMYKMAPFLKLVADAKLFGLGDWLLYSEDVDGPLIPPSTYSQPSIGIALCRYAAAKDDRSLIQSILLERKGNRRRPTVSLLRALVNSQIVLQDWNNVVFLLQTLKTAEGGGYSPSIVSHLAASILRLEMEPLSPVSPNHLEQATELLQDILEGHYNPSAGDFRVDQKLVFRRQAGLLLRFLENVPDSRVQAISNRLQRFFPLSNEALLPSDTFNILLSAVVETRGALEGRRMWDMFCKVPEVRMDFTAADGEPYDQSGVAVKDDAILAASSLAEDIPFEPTTSQEGSSATPIVVPSIRTLQIIVRGALAEQQAGPGVSREAFEELDQLLQWARPLFQSFKLSNEDIQRELQMQGSFPEAFTRHSRKMQQQRQRRTLREQNRPNVGSQFTSGALIPRPPHRPRRTQSRATR